MHIPDAVLDLKVVAGTAVLGLGGLVYGAYRLREASSDRLPVLMGSMAAFIFAAQMVNFPLGPLPASGHLLGGTLAAVLLGPWAGALVIGAVLSVQCFLFGDGGLTVLGANFLNMGLIGSVASYAIYDPIRRGVGGPRGVLLGAMFASWLAVILASGAFALELALSARGFPFLPILGWMTLVHSAIGLGEALITGAVVRFLLLVRPDIAAGRVGTEGTPPTGPVRRRSLVWGGLVAGLAVATFLAPLATELPDGLEYVGRVRVPFLAASEGNIEGQNQASAATGAREVPIPDYNMPGLGLTSPALATAVAGLLGTVVVAGVALLMAQGLALGQGRSRIAQGNLGDVV